MRHRRQEKRCEGHSLLEFISFLSKNVLKTTLSLTQCRSLSLSLGAGVGVFSNGLSFGVCLRRCQHACLDCQSLSVPVSVFSVSVSLSLGARQYSCVGDGVRQCGRRFVGLS